MKIEANNVGPSTNSIDPELIFSFIVSELDGEVIPFDYIGELFTEDGKKICDLHQISSAYSRLFVNAKGTTSNRGTNAAQFILNFSGKLSREAIQYIESYRTEEKTKTKDVILKVKLNVQSVIPKLVISSIKVDRQNSYKASDGNHIYPVIYQYSENYSPSHTDMYILSGESTPTFLTFQREPIDKEYIFKIELMDWVNIYYPYFKIGNVMVYEIIEPEAMISNSSLLKKYNKAQEALIDMKKQLGYGEWKQAVIACRPIAELFKAGDEFKKFYIDQGYTEAAYNDLKKTTAGFFGLLSKFYHALDENRVDVNPEIPVYKEDAHFAYMYCMGIMQLVSNKAKRN